MSRKNILKQTAGFLKPKDYMSGSTSILKCYGNWDTVTAWKNIPGFLMDDLPEVVLSVSLIIFRMIILQYLTKLLSLFLRSDVCGEATGPVKRHLYSMLVQTSQ